MELMGIQLRDSLYPFSAYYENRVDSLASPFEKDSMIVPITEKIFPRIYWPDVYKYFEFDRTHYIEIGGDSSFSNSTHVDSNKVKVQDLYDLYGENFYSRNYVVDHFAGDTLWSPVTFFTILTTKVPKLLFPSSDTVLNISEVNFEWVSAADSLVALKVYKEGVLEYSDTMLYNSSVELSAGHYKYVLEYINSGVTDSVSASFTLITRPLDSIREDIDSLYQAKEIKNYKISSGECNYAFHLFEDGYGVSSTYSSSSGPYPVYSYESYSLNGDWGIRFYKSGYNPQEEYQWDTTIMIDERSYPDYLSSMVKLYKSYFKDTIPEVYPILNSLLLSCKEETSILHDSNQSIDMGFPVTISTMNKKLAIRSLGKDVTASLVTVSGRRVWKPSTIKANSVFKKDLSSLSGQVYFLVLKTENKTKTVKLIK